MNTRTRPRVRAVNLRKPAAPFSAQARAQPARLETAPGTGIADPVKFRERIRLNRAIARTAVVSDRDELAEFERIIGSDDLLPFYVLELGARLGTAVCKLGFDDEEDGTGFLLGPDVLLTNHHVLPDPARARLARCIFEYQLGVDRKPKETVAFRLDPDSLFITSPAETGLDYTFVRIDAAAAIRFGQIPASRGSFGSLQGEYAHVVQHPAGKMKRVTYRDNRIYEDDGLFIRYTADTEPGSSGSPVFNNDWQLIGLHHRSRRITQAQIDAEPELARYQYLNQAIKLSAVASDLENRLQGDAKLAAREVLRCFGDTDLLLGYFGALGRPLGPGQRLREGGPDLSGRGPRYRRRLLEHRVVHQPLRGEDARDREDLCRAEPRHLRPQRSPRRRLRTISSASSPSTTGWSSRGRPPSRTRVRASRARPCCGIPRPWKASRSTGRTRSGPGSRSTAGTSTSSASRRCTARCSTAIPGCSGSRR